MLRKFGLGLTLAASLAAANVNALGMGEIRVKSALNEPLHAEIALFQINNLSPLQIKSRMADLNDFALSGLATQQALSNVRFQVRVRPNGTGRIILTSKLPVTEPFMNFLVEVNWPNGRLIREYTLLLDPPSYQSSLNGRPFKTNNNVVKTTPKTKPASAKKSPSSSKHVPAGVVVGKGQYYITERDTLWDIAIENRPSKRVTPQQMMVLMQQKNPPAFPNANINVMKAKEVIDLPTQAEIDGLSVKDAQAEVVRQTKLWKSGKLPKIVESVAKTDKDDKAAKAAEEAAKKTAAASDKKTKSDAEKAKADAKPEPKTKSAEDQMKKSGAEKVADDDASTEKGMLNVITPEEEAKRLELQAKTEAMALAASKDSEKIAQLLQNNAELDVKLALSQESIDKLERDNSELNKKLETIVKQLEDINRLISLKDEQLAVMQDELSDVENDQQKKEEAESSKSWLDKLLENTFGVIAAGIGWLLAIVAGVFLLLRRKKKGPDEDEIASDAKSEPTISLPEDVIAEEGELEELEESVPAEEPSADMDDLDLDLDLDMDMDLDESFDSEALDVSQEDDGDETDLAAELEAQLSAPAEDEDDDDLDMLEGIDSLEFDLGEVESEEAAEDLDQAEESEEDAEERALAEFAAAMEDDGGVSQDDELEIEMLSEDDTDEFAEDDEPQINIDDSDSSTVEEDELDIDEITEPVSSLEELESEQNLADEATEAADTDLAQDMLDSDLFDLPDEETSKSDEPVSDDPQDLVDQDLSIELDEDDSEVAGESEELSLDGAVIDEEEEEEQIPMDDTLDSLLSVDDEQNLAEDVSEEAASSDENVVDIAEPVLDEELNELLSSTDDDIALDTSAPEFDADNEDNIDLLSGEDGVRMKLDLARAYVEMGDDQGAKDIIDEVMSAGDDEQKSEAQELLASLSSK